MIDIDNAVRLVGDAYKQTGMVPSSGYRWEKSEPDCTIDGCGTGALALYLGYSDPESIQPDYREVLDAELAELLGFEDPGDLFVFELGFDEGFERARTSHLYSEPIGAARSNDLKTAYKEAYQLGYAVGVEIYNIFIREDLDD